MQVWTRRALAIPVVIVALICAVAAWGSAQARQGDSSPGGPGGDIASWSLDHVPLRGEGINMAVRTVVLQHQGRTYTLSAKQGLTVKSQNVLPLANVPLLGQLTDPPYERPAFAERHRVAPVRAEGGTLAVSLPDTVPLPGGVVIFNQNNAFFLRDKPVQASDSAAARHPDTGMPAAAAPVVDTAVAGAYFNPEEGNLLIMVRPSIILDGGIF